MEGERRKTRRGSSDVEVGVTLSKGMHCVIKGVSPFTDFIILEPKSWSTDKITGASGFFCPVCVNVLDYVFW